jgi:hypothetical protein
MNCESFTLYTSNNIEVIVYIDFQHAGLWQNLNMIRVYFYFSPKHGKHAPVIIRLYPLIESPDSFVLSVISC